MIRLTRATSPEPIWVRPAAIVAMTHRLTGGARLSIAGVGTEDVAESPEQVLTVIKAKRPKQEA